MTQIEDKVQDGMELINLLLHTTDETSGCHGDQSWSITSPEILSPAGGGEDNDTRDFLEVLLGGSSESSSSAPVSPMSLWSPSPSDSGVSDDLDSPPPGPPASPPFPDLCTQPVPPQLDASSSNLLSNDEKTDICIDLGWESDHLQESFGIAYYLTNSQNSRLSTNHTLSVKDLLLSNLGQKAQRSSQHALHELVLNEDEKKLLAKEGVNLPNKLPLSKFEERVLKKIRRKIRNKRSAQESRKKKKEYVDSLEGRMSACSAHNLELQRKVQQLEQNNTSLLEQLSRMQALLSNGKTPQKGTCILVVLLSLSLLLSPSLQPDPYSQQASQGQYSETKVASRSLQSVEEPSDDGAPSSSPSAPLLSMVSRGARSLSLLMDKLWSRQRYSADPYDPHHHHHQQQQQHAY